MNLIEQLMQESCKLTQSKRKRVTESKKPKKKVNESVSVGDVYEMKLSDDADPRHGISNSLHGTFKVARVEGNWAYCKPQDEAAKDWVIYMTTMDEDEIDPETLQYYDSEGLVGFEDWYLEDEFNKLNESKKSSISRKKVNEDFEYDETSEEDRGIYDWISRRVASDIFYKFWEGFNDPENQDFMEAIGLLVKVYKSMYNRQKK